MRPPQVPEQPVAVFTDDELSRLLRACQGKRDREPPGYRAAAHADRHVGSLHVAPLTCWAQLARFRLRRGLGRSRRTGRRAAELCGLSVDDLDPEQRVAHVMGKGRRGRAVPYGAKTVDAIRRYLRVRSVHMQAATRPLWLGRKGTLTDSGFRQVLEGGRFGLRRP